MFTFLPGPFLVQFSGPFYLSSDKNTATADQIKFLKDMKMIQTQDEMINTFEVLQAKHLAKLDIHMDETPTEIIGNLSDMDFD